MPILHTRRLRALAAVALSLAVTVAGAQSVGNSGSVNGTVVDATGAVLAGAKVELRNPVSGFDRSATTDSNGKFAFTNIPFNPYHLTVFEAGFMESGQDVEPRSSVPVSVSVKLDVAGSTTAVTVEAQGGDLVENDPTFHTDVDRNLFDKLPLESQSSSVSSLVTLVDAGHCGGLQWPVSWTGRPCRKLVFGGRAADYRPAKQSILQPDSAGFNRIDGSDLGRTARGIWRQDKRCDQRDNAVRAGHDYAPRRCNGFLRVVWHLEPRVQPGLWRAEVGEFCLRERIEQRPFS